ncbi:hypothetical protein RV13_GL003844 [Enterococcus raffinosus]|nr:hypothetical protein RV13_GL003844 [Enterococcus raffinosus]
MFHPICEKNFKNKVLFLYYRNYFLGVIPSFPYIFDQK